MESSFTTKSETKGKGRNKMTFKKALEKNANLLEKIKGESTLNLDNSENQKLIKEYLLRSLGDAGFIVLQMFIGSAWKIK